MSGRRPSPLKDLFVFARAHGMWVIVPFLLVLLALAALVLVASVPTLPLVYRSF